MNRLRYRVEALPQAMSRSNVRFENHADRSNRARRSKYFKRVIVLGLVRCASTLLQMTQRKCYVGAVEGSKIIR
jgi:hypothetical protein